MSDEELHELIAGPKSKAHLITTIGVAGLAVILYLMGEARLSLMRA